MQTWSASIIAWTGNPINIDSSSGMDRQCERSEEHLNGVRPMKKFLRLVLATLAIFCLGGAHASSYFFNGTLDSDDGLEFFRVVIGADSTLTATTLSFGGGTAFSGQNVSAGGFAPVLALFDQAGLLQQLSVGSAGSCVGTANSQCWDATLTSMLTSGFYTLVLSQDGNVPMGPTLTDGYLFANNAFYTGTLFLGDPSKKFIGADGSQRTGSWALTIEGAYATASLVPEPASAVSLVLGLIVIAGLLYPKRLSRGVKLATFLGASSLAPIAASAAEAVVVADSHVSVSQPSLNFGSLPQVAVGAGSVGLFRFDLSHLPPGTTASQIKQANLVLWTTRVGTAGTIEAQRVFGPWNEGTVTAGGTPTLGGTGSGAAFNVSAANQFSVVDITAWARDWISNPGSNYGIALVASAGTQVFFESKEGGGRYARIDLTLSDAALVSSPQCVGNGRILQFDGARFVCFNAQSPAMTYVHPDSSAAFGCAGLGWQGLTVTIKNDFFSGRTVTLSASNLRADYNWANANFSSSLTNAFPVSISYANGRDVAQLMVAADGNLYGRCKTYTDWELMHSGLF